MFIERKARYDLPRDAIILTEEQALRHYTEKLNKWKNKWDIWPFTWCVPVLGLTAFSSNMYAIHYYRNRTKLGDVGRVLFYIIFGAVPSFGAAVAHHSLISPRILLQKECSNCSYLRAAAIQGGIFLAYGCVATPAMTFVNAVIRGTYPVPGFGSIAQLRGTWELYLKFTKRIATSIVFIVVCNMAVASYFVYKEYSAFEVLNQKFYEQEQELRAKTRELKESLKQSDQNSPVYKLEKIPKKLDQNIKVKIVQSKKADDKKE